MLRAPLSEEEDFSVSLSLVETLRDDRKTWQDELHWLLLQLFLQLILQLLQNLQFALKWYLLSITSGRSSVGHVAHCCDCPNPPARARRFNPT